MTSDIPALNLNVFRLDIERPHPAVCRLEPDTPRQAAGDYLLLKDIKEFRVLNPGKRFTGLGFMGVDINPK